MKSSLYSKFYSAGVTALDLDTQLISECGTFSLGSAVTGPEILTKKISWADALHAIDLSSSHRRNLYPTIKVIIVLMT